MCATIVSFGQHFSFEYFSFIPISDLSVTVKTGDISGDSSSRGQVTENGDCPRKPGMSGHPSIGDTSLCVQLFYIEHKTYCFMFLEMNTNYFKVCL